MMLPNAGPARAHDGAVPDAGYLGVPVAFALIAGVLVGTMFTPITLQSIIGQLFNGVDSEA